jgi:hypothetical protein
LICDSSAADVKSIAYYLLGFATGCEELLVKRRQESRLASCGPLKIPDLVIRPPKHRRQR